MEQTAVEWLIDSLISEPYSEEDFQYNSDMWNKAKEMEKQQIIESYCQGCFDISLNKNIFPRETSEQYYNEQFNK
jgi:hypothetical protein